MSRSTRAVAALLLVATAFVRVAALACEIACVAEPSARRAAATETAHTLTTACHEPAPPVSPERTSLSAAASVGACDHEAVAPTILPPKPHAIAAGTPIGVPAFVPSPVTVTRRATSDHAPPGPALSPFVSLRI